MSERRSLMDKIFGALRQKREVTHLRVLSGHAPVFTPWENLPYEADVVRAAVDAVARNAAKLKAKHVRRTQGQVAAVCDQMERVLTQRPNPHMSAYDFIYRLTTTLMIDNNAFAYPVWGGADNAVLAAVWPVNAVFAEFVEDQSKVIYIRFHFGDGGNVVLPYSEVIHLRRHYYSNDLLGEPNTPINSALKAVHTTNEGLSQAVKTSASLRGILKYQGLLKDSDVKANRERFVTEYMTMQNSGGVAALDGKADYIELKNTAITINAAQMKELRDTVFRYFGVSEAIVEGDYTEDQWNAFYESTIEPLAVQMSLEFTAKLFTDRERGFGNEIVFEANRLQYASAKTKTTLIERMVPMGLLTVNEAREIFNLAPVDGGDKRIVSLNYVQADKQNIYQLGEEGGTEDVKNQE